MAKIYVPKTESKADGSLSLEKTKEVLKHSRGKRSVLKVGGAFDGELLHALADDAGLLDKRTMSELYGEILSDIPGKGVEERMKILKGVLGFLVDWGTGQGYTVSMRNRGITMLELGFMKKRSRLYKRLYDEADILRMGQMVPQVMDAAVDLAVNGDIEPIYSKEGELLGEKRKRNVKAQEMILKAGDSRFADDKKDSAVAGGGVVYNIAVLPNVKLPEPGSMVSNVVDIDEKEELVDNGVQINLGLGGVDSLPTDL